MEDEQILSLYFARSEQAIGETHRKYGRYCGKIAFNILLSREDSEECVSDTYLKAWNVIPPRRPSKLQIFLGKITRNLALDRLDWNRTTKRGGGETALSLEELRDCIPDGGTPEDAIALKDLTQALNRFLAELPAETRKIFLRRYWNLSSVKEIASFYGVSESKVKMTLMRTRGKLKDYLTEEGITL